MLSSKVNADFTQFDFSLGRYLLDENKEIKVDFKYDILNYVEKNFLVRPVINNGIVEIFNSETNLWVNSYSNISELPFLENEMLIRIKGLRVEKSCVHFEIFNIKNGEKYNTPVKDVWSEKVYSKYIGKLNKNLSGYLVKKEEISSGGGEYLEFVEIGDTGKFDLSEVLKSAPKSYLTLAGLGIFSVSFFLGFKGKITNPKKKNLDVETRVYGVNGKIH